ncbi:MAG: Rpn family recombination-promoting nuclease/putative transposase [Planctomycetes bacterium]|nr:Rpn family recombination-promoting nuclease/putative transposase [Planctomycetota bacterium]
MPIGVEPTVDYAFKHLFGREASQPILIDLIDSVLEPAPAHRIREIELMNPFNPKETFDDKMSIVDIKARDESGRQFNIEMQMLAYSQYEKRILYYACKLHQQQMHEGEEYLKLCPTISISFLDHVLFRHRPNWHHHFQLLEKSHFFPLTGDLEFHVLELPKFTKDAGDLTSELDKWLYFLRHAAKMEVGALPAKLQQPLVMRALEDLKMLTQTDIERERYEARRTAILDENTRMKAARLEGIEEGREEGREEGQRHEAIEVIRRLEDALGRPQTPAEDLEGLSRQDLMALRDDLLHQVAALRK